ncbi:MAG: biotin/lipoyl-binding protein [Ruminococcaceae bacterium]|nr:biotin/lipoyl-binding protein [Oscillospiraceae bacterium]
MKYIVTLNGKDYEVDVTELDEAIVTNVSEARQNTPAPAAASAPAEKPKAEVSGEGTPVKAPMPGTILKVNVEENQKVNEGDVLFILEAMKMENEIVSPVSGTVTKLVASKGTSAATDDILAFIG